MLVPYGDAGAFAREALTLLRDRELWGRHSAGGPGLGLPPSDWDRCIRESLDLFEQTVRRNRERGTA